MIEIKHYKVVESTQDLAKAYLKSGYKKIAAFFAEGQTSGYGKQGRFFYSPKSTGIYFSLVVPDFKRGKRINLLTPAVVTSIVSILKKFFPNKDFRIKWVNDVYLDGKKVGGILTENLQGGLVVGVGINLNTRDFPGELSEKATQITAEDIHSQDRIQLGEALIQASWEAIQSYEDGKFLKQYCKLSCLFGKKVELRIGKKIVTGEAITIDEDARLLVRVGDREVGFSSGEVTRVLVEE